MYMPTGMSNIKIKSEPLIIPFLVYAAVGDSRFLRNVAIYQPALETYKKQAILAVSLPG
jgi:hypothetical protein